MRFKQIILIGLIAMLGGQIQAQAVQEKTASQAPEAVSVQEKQTSDSQPDVAASSSTDTTVAEDQKASEDKTVTQEKAVDPNLEKDLQQATAPVQEVAESFVAPREGVAEEPAPAVLTKPKVVYNPKTQRDPTLSPDDYLLLEFREQQRLAALEAERKRKLEEERRKREEEERLRLLELARIKDPTREVRNRIHIDGIVGKEVFIGDKVYTVGNKIFGAMITNVTSDEVVFSYKGHKFVKKMK